MTISLKVIKNHVQLLSLHTYSNTKKVGEMKVGESFIILSI